MYRSALAAALLALSPALAIPPEDFGFPSAPNDTALGVTFNPGSDNEVVIMEAELLGPDVALQPPQVTVNASQYRSIAEYNGAYVLMMVDPDASTPQNPTSRFILHWMAANLTASPDNGVLTNSTPAVAEYAHPMPPPNSDAHRYILYAFQQPDDFAVPDAYAGYGGMNRSNFNVTDFLSQAALDQPAAANYFFVQNKTGTPPDFTASAGGSYPGGNGAAITAGPGPSVAPMSSMMGGSMMSGSMMSGSTMSSTMMGSMGPSMTESGGMSATGSAAAGASSAAAAADRVGMGAAVVAAAGGIAAFAL
ncbi:MAG: hypothetical protein Q9162_004562 [Coniocarpon cinnabarinum]